MQRLRGINLIVLVLVNMLSSSTRSSDSTIIKLWKNSKVIRAMKGFFKTWLFLNLGGQHWVKFLIAIDDVPRDAIEATNKVVDERMFDRRTQRSGQSPRPIESSLPRNAHSADAGRGGAGRKRKRKLPEAPDDMDERAQKRRRTLSGAGETEQATGVNKYFQPPFVASHTNAIHSRCIRPCGCVCVPCI